jgi:hypothetical protein
VCVTPCASSVCDTTYKLCHKPQLHAELPHTVVEARAADGFDDGLGLIALLSRAILSAVRPTLAALN